MKKALARLGETSAHLGAIDDFFIDHDEAYAKNEAELEALERFYDEFARQLYPGGRKDGQHATGGRYHRGMALNDLLTYVILGRGFYAATSSPEHRKAFVQILLRVVNKLLLQENISVDIQLRNGLLDSVSALDLPHFHEDDDQRERFDALRAFKGKIIWNEEGKEHYPTMDAQLPKSRGLAIELLVYLYLTQRNFGLVVPLLLHQRLLSSTGELAPPDFLIVKKDKRIIGIEVGSLKEQQNARFVSASSIPTVTAELDGDQPFRCPKCEKWIPYCQKVVKTYAAPSNAENPLRCVDCVFYNGGRCSEIILYGKKPRSKGWRRYHYSCVRDEDWVREALATEDGKREQLLAWYPTVSILDGLID